jgi:hypothetical protein
LKIYITDYYKKLFGAPTEDMVTDIPQISPYENTILTAASAEEEVFDVISQMKLIKLLDHTGFQLSSISSFGRLLSKISRIYLRNCNNTTSNCLS